MGQEDKSLEQTPDKAASEKKSGATPTSPALKDDTKVVTALALALNLLVRESASAAKAFAKLEPVDNPATKLPAALAAPVINLEILE